MAELERQIEDFGLTHEDIQILYLGDNRSMTVGHKRNLLLQLAQGKYVCFIDDDDEVYPHYVGSIWTGTHTNKDAICFNAHVSLNGGEKMPCYFSKNYGNENKANRYFRLPNHLMCLKRSQALKVKYPDISFGEDMAYSKEIVPIIRDEHLIDDFLYHYKFNSKTSESYKT